MSRARNERRKLERGFGKPVVQRLAEEHEKARRTRRARSFWQSVLRDAWYERARVAFQAWPEGFTLGVVAFCTVVALGVLVFSGVITLAL